MTRHDKLENANQWRRNKVEGGGEEGGKAHEKKFVLCPSTFLALQVELVGMGERFCKMTDIVSRGTIFHSLTERFCDGQYSLVRYLFAVLLLTVSPTTSHL